MLDSVTLHELFIADFKTGDLRWRSSPCRAIPARSIAGHISREGYWRVKIKGKRYMVHKVLWAMATGEWPELLDHINGVGTDNRLVNLRLASVAQNMANRRRGVGTYPRGVRLHRNGRRWFAVFRSQHIGMFDTMDAAHRAYLAAAQQHYGEFARSD
jgi:hypothetical protein